MTAGERNGRGDPSMIAQGTQRGFIDIEELCVVLDSRSSLESLDGGTAARSEALLASLGVLSGLPESAS